MDRDPTHAAPFLDHEHGHAAFGSLDGGTAAGWTAADNDGVVTGHRHHVAVQRGLTQG